MLVYLLVVVFAVDLQYSIVQYSTVQCCTVQCCTALYCTALYCTHTTLPVSTAECSRTQTKARVTAKLTVVSLLEQLQQGYRQRGDRPSEFGACLSTTRFIRGNRSLRAGNEFSLQQRLQHTSKGGWYAGASLDDAGSCSTSEM